MAGHRDDDSLPERKEHHPNRRVERPMRPWIPVNKRTGNSGTEQGKKIGSSMADMIKKMVYDAEFNNIVGLPNDIVAGPQKEEM